MVELLVVTVATARFRDTRAGATALADHRSTLTWEEVDDRLNRIANRLLASGIDPGGRCTVFAENAAETVLIHLGAVLAGVSTVPASFHLTVPELAYLLEDSASSLLLAGPETAEVAVAAAAEAGVGTVVVWRASTDVAAPAGVEVIDWDDWVAAGSPEEPPTAHRPAPHLHYTSGTTGRPKGTETPPAMFAGGADIVEHVAALDANPMLGMGGAALVVSPLYHTGPLTSIRGLLAGTALVVLGRFDAEATLAAIEQHGVTTTVLVPTHFQRLLALDPEVRARYDTSSLLLVAHTGAACPVGVKRQMIEWWGPVLFEAYGGTEVGTTNAIMASEWLEHPGSVGRCLPPFEVVVVDDEGSPVPVGTTGRLFFRDGTGRGIVYHNDPEKTLAAHLEPGVFTLGEIGYVDADGYVYITDRASDMVVSGGVNVYPAEAEACLAGHPGVRDVAVIGVPDDDLGEGLLALVVPTDAEAPPTPGDLMEHCAGQLARYKTPKRYELRADLGRNAMGKLNKRELRAPYWPDDRTIG